MASDYISREAVFKAFAPFCKDCRFSDDEKNCECCPHGPTKLKLNSIPPAADVIPVEWILKQDGGDELVKQWKEAKK